MDDPSGLSQHRFVPAILLVAVVVGRIWSGLNQLGHLGPQKILVAEFQPNLANGSRPACGRCRVMAVRKAVAMRRADAACTHTQAQRPRPSTLQRHAQLLQLILVVAGVAEVCTQAEGRQVGGQRKLTTAALPHAGTRRQRGPA